MMLPERTVRTSALVRSLVAVPCLYVALSYAYLANWHGTWWLWDTVVHENGRLTLAGSMYYFDHFLGCAPMATVFALILAGGCALAGGGGPLPAPERARRFGSALLLAAAVFFVVGFLASVHFAGWERTFDYLWQRIERDGVLSKGGNWNQLQLSNAPIALGMLGIALTLGPGRPGSRPAALAVLGLATAISAALTASVWPGWEAFRNPRWLAHSLRELATYPLTGVPLATAAIVLAEYWLSGAARWRIRPRAPAAALLGVAGALAALELAMLGGTDVLALAQRPSFAPQGLPVAYLLASHVFEHFLDFAFFAILASGVYALLRARCPGEAHEPTGPRHAGSRPAAPAQPGRLKPWRRYVSRRAWRWATTSGCLA